MSPNEVGFLSRYSCMKRSSRKWYAAQNISTGTPGAYSKGITAVRLVFIGLRGGGTQQTIVRTSGSGIGDPYAQTVQTNQKH